MLYVQINKSRRLVWTALFMSFYVYVNFLRLDPQPSLCNNMYSKCTELFCQRNPLIGHFFERLVKVMNFNPEKLSLPT